MSKTKQPKFSRILLKLSGEALGGESGVGICPEAVRRLAGAHAGLAGSDELVLPYVTECYRASLG